MNLRLTPEMLAAMWDCLRQLPPFDAWRLPSSDHVEFRAPRRHDVFGEFRAPNIVVVSSALHGRFNTAFQTLSHEAIHFVQYLDKTESKSQHNADFCRRARSVCRIFGYDYRGF
jgi:hypothetical protein